MAELPPASAGLTEPPAGSWWLPPAAQAYPTSVEPPLPTEVWVRRLKEQAS